MAAKKTPDDSSSSLQAYLRDVARHPVMTRDDERRLSAELMAARHDGYHQVLSYPPFAAAVLELIRQTVEIPDELAEGFERVATTARRVRDSNRKAVAEEHAREVEELSASLAMVDPECAGAARIAADLHVLSGRRDGDVELRVAAPRVGSQPFADYVDRVDQAAKRLQVARNRFARANLRLVLSIANRFQKHALPRHDRVQEGNLGLMKAIDRFDPTRGFRFSTYATWWIKHWIRRAAVNHGRAVRIPAHIHYAASTLITAHLELEQRLGRTPTAEELASATKMTAKKVTHTLRSMAQHQVSLDAPVANDDRRTLAEALVDDDQASCDDLLHDKREANRVRERVANLGGADREVVIKRFGLNGDDPRTLRDIADEHGLSRERIRQIQVRAIGRLRKQL